MSQGWGQNNQGWGNQGQGNPSWSNQVPNNPQNNGWGNQGTNVIPGQPQNQGNVGWGNQGNNGWGNQQPNQNWSNQAQTNSSNGWGVQFIQPTQPSQNSSTWNQHKGWGTSANNTMAPQQTWVQPQPAQYNSGWGDQLKNQATINNSTIKSKGKFDSNREYYIVTGLSNDYVLGISQDPQTKNKGILCKRTGMGFEKFKLTEIEGGKYKISCSSTGLILQIPNNSAAKGVSVFANYASNTPNQTWQLIETKDGDGGFFIKSFCGKCLDVCQQKVAHGTPIIQYDYNGGKNQVWYFKEA